MLERTAMRGPSLPAARSAALWTAAAASAARCGASSIGSNPNAATMAVGLISSMRPPKVWTFSTRISKARLGLYPGSISAGRTRVLRRNASRRPSQRTARGADVSATGAARGAASAE